MFTLLLSVVLSVLLVCCYGKPLNKNVSTSNDLSVQVGTHTLKGATSSRRWGIVDGPLLKGKCRDCYRRCYYGDAAAEHDDDHHGDDDGDCHGDHCSHQGFQGNNECYHGDQGNSHHGNDDDDNCDHSCRDVCHNDQGYHGDRYGHDEGENGGHFDHGNSFHGNDEGYHDDHLDHDGEGYHGNDEGNHGYNIGHDGCSYHGNHKGDLGDYCRDAFHAQHNDHDDSNHGNDESGNQRDNCCCQPCITHQNVIHDCHHQCPPVVNQKFGNWQNDRSFDKISHHCAEWDQGEMAQPPLGANIHPIFQSGINNCGTYDNCGGHQ